MPRKILRIGTRKSPLALYQARLVESRLKERHPDLSMELVPITTSGDKTQASNRNLTTIGGKGLFLKELEIALRDKSIDIAVHSLKDVPTWRGSELVLPCVLEREDARDAFISLKYNSLQEVKEGAILGTSSPRRQSQALNIKSALTPVPFRGNVGTRIEKLAAGKADFTFLALAGLKRLGMEANATQIMPVEAMVPAIGQGAIAIETLVQNNEVRALLKTINHEGTVHGLNAERALLATLGGSCITPIGCHCRPHADGYELHAFIGTEDGDKTFTLHELSKQGESAIAFGHRCGILLHQKIPAFLLSQLGLHLTPPSSIDAMEMTPCGF